MNPTWLRTHDDALDLLRYAVPGAVIELAPTRGGGDAARAYQITLLGARIRVSGGDTYHLPCLAAPIARRAREIADGLRDAVRQ
jgi:hypothetical protein